MYFTDPSLFADYVPVYKTLGAPYLYPSYEVVEKFMQSDTMKAINADAEAAACMP
jgi:TRAP-type C4-dicarboxylate transport system substrate-binding protein